MPTWTLSQRSRDRLTGVNPALVAVVERAIQLSAVDFGITEGLRTAERQTQLVAAGASSTMNSRHLTGDAVDVVAYVGGAVSWKLSVYCQIAAAFREASMELHQPIRWGGCWSLLRDLPDDAEGIEDAVETYSARRRAMGRRALIDGPHFEIPA